MLLVVALLTPLLSVVLSYKDPHYVRGHDTMVHLFEWRWNDIARECEDFLGPMGYGGVQVSPIQENVIVPPRPWWERYQPISYLWKTRSGTEVEFKDMVSRCNKAGVRIYVDAVVNHMTGDHKTAVGTAGSKADTYNLHYPVVPYNSVDFHSKCSINDFEDPIAVRNCELVGLHDLNQTTEHVREKIVDFLNAAIDAGVAGFRIDAARHMWPEDLKVIYSRLNDLNVKHGFRENSRPYIYQEVIDHSTDGRWKKQYNNIGAVTEFRYGSEISNAMKGKNPLKWFVSWGEKWALLPSSDALVFIDNHDNQRSADSNVLTYKSSKLYKMSVAFMLAHPYGNPRVMSSFDFKSFDQSPPVLPAKINEDNTCSNGWICEHRWRQIYNMARFRVVANDTAIDNWWDNGNYKIAFCRGNVGFIAINADHSDFKENLHACLPSGVYCDVISGNLINGKCTGKTVTVNSNGKAYIEILKNEEDGVLAIHRDAKMM